MLNLHFKTIDKNDEIAIKEVVRLESTEFPPNEVREEKYMREQIKVAPTLFLLAYANDKVVAYLNGISTDENKFRDEYYTNMKLYDKNGKNIMLLGLAVSSDYQGMGIGRAIMNNYKELSKELGHKRLVLTCLPRLVDMYKKFGFNDCGISDSKFGGEVWHDMDLLVDSSL